MQGNEIQMNKIKIIDGRINFSCLQQDCPQTCCGPFSGVHKGIESIDNREFSDIILSNEEAQQIINEGFSGLIDLAEDGLYEMRLFSDGSCKALKNGLCTIHNIKPQLCKAYPFYIDMFAGLCASTSCPGFGAGWTLITELESEILSTLEVYGNWLSRIRLDLSKMEDFD